MKIKTLIYSFVLIANIFMLAKAQTSSADVKTDQSITKGKIYQNYRYKFNFMMPANWTEVSSNESKEYLKLGQAILNPNEAGQKQIKESVNLTQILLSLSKYPPGTSGNASLLCAIETSQTPQATLAQTSLASQESFKENFGYTVTSESKQVMLGGESFYLFKVRKTVESDVTLYQSVYLKKIDGQFLQFVLSYQKPVDEAIMQGSLQTLKFTK